MLTRGLEAKVCRVVVVTASQVSRCPPKHTTYYLLCTTSYIFPFCFTGKLNRIHFRRNSFCCPRAAPPYPLQRHLSFAGRAWRLRVIGQNLLPRLAGGRLAHPSTPVPGRAWAHECVQSVFWFQVHIVDIVVSQINCCPGILRHTC